NSENERLSTLSLSGDGADQAAPPGAPDVDEVGRGDLLRPADRLSGSPPMRGARRGSGRPGSGGQAGPCPGAAGVRAQGGSRPPGRIGKASLIQWFIRK